MAGQTDSQMTGATARHVAGEGREVPGPAVLRGELVARAARLLVPLSAQIETTTRCNLRCVHCYVPCGHGGVVDELTIDRHLSLIDELADAGCMFLTLTGGEVSLKKGWLSLVEHARRRRMSVHILTNGTLLSVDDAAALAELHVRQVSVSIYGDRAAAHDRITGVPGSFERSVAAVRALRSAGVRVRLATVLMRENGHCYAGVRRLADSLGCTYRFDPTVRPMSDGDSAPVSHRLPADDLYHLYADPVIGPRTLEGRWARMAEQRVARAEVNGCSGGVASVFVDALGDVYACPGFKPAFGNVRWRSFPEVWRGAKAEEFRRRLREPVEECLSCDQRKYCLTRCPCLAAIEDGSVSGRSTRACEIASVVRRLCEQGSPVATADMRPGSQP